MTLVVRVVWSGFGLSLVQFLYGHIWKVPQTFSLWTVANELAYTISNLRNAPLSPNKRPEGRWTCRGDQRSACFTRETPAWDSVRLHCQHCVKGPTTVVDIRHNSCCSHCKYLHAVGTPHMEGFSLSVVWRRSSHANKTRGGDLVCLLRFEEDGKLKLTSLRSSRSHKLPLNFDPIFHCSHVSMYLLSDHFFFYCESHYQKDSVYISTSLFILFTTFFWLLTLKHWLLKVLIFILKKTEFISDFPF